MNIVYRKFEDPNRAMNRMMECLGEPTIEIKPMPYVSDIITPEGRREAVLKYPIVLIFEEASE